jgi:cytochrome c553
MNTQPAIARPRSSSSVLLGAIMILVVPCALAAQTAPQAKPAGAKPAAEAPAAPCEACHGAHGEGMAAAHVPRIAGQSAEYLKKQLDDYADGTRDNPVMTNFAKALSETQRIKYAMQYASMPTLQSPQAKTLNTVQLARGHQLAFQGDERIRVQACNSCHGPDGIGVLHAAPYLAGQSADFIVSALKSFQQGTRKNDAGELMRSVAKQLNDADVIAISGYFAQVNISTK